jgi:hypothetical protein
VIGPSTDLNAGQFNPSNNPLFARCQSARWTNRARSRPKCRWGHCLLAGTTNCPGESYLVALVSIGAVLFGMCRYQSPLGKCWGKGQHLGPVVKPAPYEFISRPAAPNSSPRQIPAAVAKTTGGTICALLGDHATGDHTILRLVGAVAPRRRAVPGGKPRQATIAPSAYCLNIGLCRPPRESRYARRSSISPSWSVLSSPSGIIETGDFLVSSMS